MLYADSPKVKDFLFMQRNVEFNEIIARVKYCIRECKKINEWGRKYKDSCLDYKDEAYGTINLLRQYNDMPNYAQVIKNMEDLYEEIKDYPKSTFSRLFGG